MSVTGDRVSEVERLIDELESFAEKSPWYLPNKIAIRDEDFFRITQHIREFLPAELAEARATLQKRDQILKNAKEEHRRIMESAERRLEDMTSVDQVVLTARQEAEKLLERAAVEAESIRLDALKYTMQVLEKMEHQFNQTLGTIQQGLEFLENEVKQEMGEDHAQLSELSAGETAGFSDEERFTPPDQRGVPSSSVEED